MHFFVRLERVFGPSGWFSRPAIQPSRGAGRSGNRSLAFESLEGRVMLSASSMSAPPVFASPSAMQAEVAPVMSVSSTSSAPPAANAAVAGVPQTSNMSGVTLVTLGTINNIVIFEALNGNTGDVQLRASTATGTTLLHDFGTNVANLTVLATADNTLIFQAVNFRTSDAQLWGTHGTASGTAASA